MSSQLILEDKARLRGRFVLCHLSLVNPLRFSDPQEHSEEKVHRPPAEIYVLHENQQRYTVVVSFCILCECPIRELEIIL
jgi:hypothetical protein